MTTAATVGDVLSRAMAAGRRIARRWGAGWDVRDDAAQEGVVAVLEAMPRVAALAVENPETYLVRCAVRGVFSAVQAGRIRLKSDSVAGLRAASQYRGRKGTERLSSDCPEADVANAVARDPDPATAAEVRDVAARMLAAMTPAQRRVVELYLGLDGCAGRPLREVGELTGTTLQHTHETLRGGLGRAAEAAGVVDYRPNFRGGRPGVMEKGARSKPGSQRSRKALAKRLREAAR